MGSWILYGWILGFRYLSSWVVSVTRTQRTYTLNYHKQSSKGYQQIHAPDYDPDKHGTGGGIVGGTADTTTTDSKTGNTSAPVTQTTEENTVSTVNERGEAQKQTEAMKKLMRERNILYM